MERTLPGLRQEARQQEPWGGLVQTPALESTTRPPPVFGREGEGNTGSPQPLRITHEELGSSRPFPAPKSRGRQVRRPAEGHCVCTKPTGSRTQGFPIATEFPTLQASPSCLRDRYHLHDAISSIITFFSLNLST